MKKLFLSLFLAAALPLALLAQAPQKFNYQAVARSTSGTVLINQNIDVRVTVLDGSATGTNVYQETHDVTTNPFGLFTVAIGDGAVQSGVFTGINWSNGAKYLKVEADFGSGFTDMGTSQLLSVPYALVAAQSANDNDEQTLSVSGNDLSISNGNSVTLPTGAEVIDDLSDVNTAGAAANQVLQWNGSQWMPATITGGVGDNWGTQTVIANSPLSGNGTAGNALKLQDGTANGQVLRWNGSAWVAQTITDNDQQTLSISGSSLTISGGNSVTIPGGSDAQTLSLSGNNLSISNGNSVALPTGTTYTAGSGIDISGTTISATDNSTTNEIQTLSLSGTTLSLSGANSVNLPSGGGSYTAGTGISISGTTITNTGDNDNNATNEIQTLSVIGNQLTISGAGGNSVTLPGGGSSLWTAAGNDIYNSNTGNVGVGTLTPQLKLEVVGTSGTAAMYGEFGGSTAGSRGIWGSNQSIGSLTQNNVGVYGDYTSAVYGAGVAGIGFNGLTTLPASTDIGVYGSAEGAGVYAVAGLGGTGAYAESDHIGFYGYNNNLTPTDYANLADAGTPAGYFWADGGKGTYSLASGTDNWSGNSLTLGATNVGNNLTSNYNIGTFSYGLGGMYNGGAGTISTTGIEAVAEADVTDVPDYVQGVVGSTLSDGWIATSAGFFAGDLEATGTVYGAAKLFKIDHPLDPTNKYLSHVCIESPEMMTIYNGNVTTNANGDATVELPDYFSALNKDVKYQLTVIGTFAQAIVANEISGNSFTIKTDKPNVKVSWQVTGVRQDAWANANRVQVETEKKGREKGKYLHPEAFGLKRQEGIAALRTASGLKPSGIGELKKVPYTKNISKR